MDYKKLIEEIKQITAITETVPDRFKEKCFEILLQKLLVSEISPSHGYAPPTPVEKLTEPLKTAKIPIPAQIRVFMGKTGVTEDELNTILLYDDGEIHFIKEPTHTTIAQGQIEWALLLALKKGIIANDLSVDPEDVRSVCQEKGFYDSANFASIFKRPKNASLFKKAPEPQGEPQALSSDGLNALGKLVKSLAGKSD